MISRCKLPHRRRLAAVGAAVAVMVGGGLAINATAASAQTVNAQQQVSGNWSGYVVQDKAGKSFSSVSGSWVQPSVSSNSSQGYAAFWVGLGGASQQSQSLEQVGTAAQTVNGQTSYYAWYELVPSAQVQLNLPIHPGDRMSGRVTVNGNTVTISLSDHTTGRSVTKTLQMSNPDTSSAEWIAEAPAAEFADGSMQILPLADFGNVTFTDASATAGGQTGSITDPAWSVERVDLSPAASSQFLGGGPSFIGNENSQQSTAGASTGGVSNAGKSFTVSYTAEPARAQSSSSTSSTAGSGYPGYGYGYPGYGYGYPGYGDGYGYPGYGYGYPGGYVAVLPY